MLRWPLREALVAFRIHRRDELLKFWQFNVLCHLLVAPWAKKKMRMPEVPIELRDIIRG